MKITFIYLSVHDFPSVLLHIIPLNEIKKISRIPSVSPNIANEAEKKAIGETAQSEIRKNGVTKTLKNALNQLFLTYTILTDVDETSL